MSAAKKRGFLVHIPADVSKEITREPFTGSAPAYESLRAAVGGLIQPVKLKYEGRSRSGYVNEEGLLQGLPFNRRATVMWREWSPVATAGQILVGPAVIVFWEKVPA